LPLNVTSTPVDPDADEDWITVGEAQLSMAALGVGGGVVVFGGAGVGGVGEGGVVLGGAGVGGTGCVLLGGADVDESSPEDPFESRFQHPCIAPAIMKTQKNVALILIAEIDMQIDPMSDLRIALRGNRK
jgi:hypothetical protein